MLVKITCNVSHDNNGERRNNHDNRLDLSRLSFIQRNGWRFLRNRVSTVTSPPISAFSIFQFLADKNI